MSGLPEWVYVNHKTGGVVHLRNHAHPKKWDLHHSCERIPIPDLLRHLDGLKPCNICFPDGITAAAFKAVPEPGGGKTTCDRLAAEIAYLIEERQDALFACDPFPNNDQICVFCQRDLATNKTHYGSCEWAQEQCRRDANRLQPANV